MQKVEKLIIKAKKQTYDKMDKLILAFIYELEKNYKVVCILNKGVKEVEQRDVEQEFSSYDEAQSFIDRVANEYPNGQEDVTVLSFRKASEYVKT